MLSDLQLERVRNSLRDSWNTSSIVANEYLSLDLACDIRTNLILSDADKRILRWVIEGIADPRRYIDNSKFNFSHIITDVKRCINHSPLLDDDNHTKIKAITKIVANIIHDQVITLRKTQKRPTISKSQKQTLLDLAGNSPRCWLTGYKFSENAIYRFLDGDKVDVPLPEYIDLLTPIGLRQADMLIEIDHVFPFSQGGIEQDNLKLSCGWANRAKSSHTSIFDSSTSTRKAANLPFGLQALPNPSWVVRLMGTIGECQVENCATSSWNSRLRIDLSSQFGAPTPVNLRVVCKNHDQLIANRFLPRLNANSIWHNK